MGRIVWMLFTLALYPGRPGSRGSPHTKYLTNHRRQFGSQRLGPSHSHLGPLGAFAAGFTDACSRALAPVIFGVL